MTHTLILVPTELERGVLQPLIEPVLRADDRVELCGFGLVAAAALTARLIAEQRPGRVLLVGIAGTFCDELPVGSATAFDEVSCFGIGVGSGQDHQTAGDVGWSHVGGRVSNTEDGDVVITDTIQLQKINVDSDAANLSRQLLTASAASGNADDAAICCRRFPGAIAEDMEGFAVAMSCRLANVPVSIVRGISNQVGDRDVTNWHIKPALEAAAELVRGTIAD